MTRQLRGIKAKKAVSAFEKAGFKAIRQKGSHLLLYREGAPLLIIPMHVKPLKIGLLRREIKKAGLTVEKFCELL